MTMPLGRTLCVATAALAMSGCGGDADPPEVRASEPAGEPLTITAREYLFTPNRITLRGSGGRAVRQRIALRNQGDLAHNIEVRRDDRIVGKLRSFRSGDTRSLAVPLAPGSYEFICTVADHDEKGMRGTLELR
jgi:plastocyanin